MSQLDVYNMKWHIHCEGSCCLELEYKEGFTIISANCGRKRINRTSCRKYKLSWALLAAGSTEIWTQIAGFRVQSADHYTMEPCVELVCSPSGCGGFLWVLHLPEPVQRHGGEVHWWFYSSIWVSVTHMEQWTSQKSSILTECQISWQLC